MKALKVFAAAAMVSLSVASCVSSPKVDPQPKEIDKGLVDTASYALGVYLAQMVEMSNFGDMDLAQIVKGYQDYYKNSENLGQDFVNESISKFAMKRQEIISEKNLAEGKAFLEENAKVEGVITTESGLQYRIERQGNGTFATSEADQVEVNYEGTTIDGKVFDSSYERSQTATFPLNRVIKGWTEGMQLIDEGGEITLWIPADLAYGQNGPMGPNQVLKFKVELIKVIPAETEEKK